MYFEATRVEPFDRGCYPVHRALPTGRRRRALDLPPSCGRASAQHAPGRRSTSRPRLNGRHSPHFRAARATGRTAGTACPIEPTTCSLLRGGMTPPHTASTTTNAYTGGRTTLASGAAETIHRRSNRCTIRLFRNRRHPAPEVPATPAHTQRGCLMSVLHRTRAAPSDPAAAASPRSSRASMSSTLPLPSQSPVDGLSTPPTRRVPRTRTGAAWMGIGAAVLSFVVLIVFMLQNTGSVEVHFLWMDGSVPLALALLIAAVGAAIVAMTVGAARIAQLRRLVRRRRR